MSNLAIDAMTQKNDIQIGGVVLTPPTFYRESYGEKMYTFDLGVPRKSGRQDVLRIMMPQKHVDTAKLGDTVMVYGQIRSYNHYDTGRRQVCIYAFCRKISLVSNPLIVLTDFNKIELIAEISEQPYLRKTPKGRHICDFRALVSRGHNKMDYIPLLAWGQNAKDLSKLELKTKIHLQGRFQSRNYSKSEHGEVHVRTAYEVSIAEFTVI